MEIKKVPDTTDLAKKADLNAKVIEIDNKIPSMTTLATNSALTAAEIKIPDGIGLVKKTDYDTKISDIQNKYITLAYYNKFTKNIVENSIRLKNLVTNAYFDAKLKELNKKIGSNKTKHLIVENDF